MCIKTQIRPNFKICVLKHRFIFYLSLFNTLVSEKVLYARDKEVETTNLGVVGMARQPPRERGRKEGKKKEREEKERKQVAKERQKWRLRAHTLDAPPARGTERFLHKLPKGDAAARLDKIEKQKTKMWEQMPFGPRDAGGDKYEVYMDKHIRPLERAAVKEYRKLGYGEDEAVERSQEVLGKS